jgi:hypothetical protein
MSYQTAFVRRHLRRILRPLLRRLAHRLALGAIETGRSPGR